MISIFCKKKRHIEETKAVNNIEINKIPKSLGDFALTDHSFYRFSQSMPGRSVENLFAEYVPGQITETIASCFLYGDMITKLNFNLSDEKFQKIANTPIKYIGHTLGEYESRYLLVEQNYSLRDITTIKMLFELVQNKNQLISLFHCIYGSLDQRLHEFGYTESEQMVIYLKKEFDKNINISLDDMRMRLREYVSQY